MAESLEDSILPWQNADSTNSSVDGVHAVTSEWVFALTYSDINNTAALIEVAKKKGNYTPELSLVQPYFFQDLVEANISYLPLYPDDKGAIFNNEFIQNSSNSLLTFVSSAENFVNVIKVIDIPRNTDGKWLRIVMNGGRTARFAWLHEM